ncbi:hypothetical protein JW921_01095 [Candidatus Fermentibacterales bacterium]|nr:hypothetical protein [Candidatus Fermentibacterales bacterium]
MVVEFREPVEMITCFRDGEVIPCRFRWRAKVHRVDRVSSSWESRVGAYKHYHFLLRTTDDDVYELHFDSYALRWVLDFEYRDGA